MLVSKTGKLIFHHGENIKEESRSGLDIDGILGQHFATDTSLPLSCFHIFLYD